MVLGLAFPASNVQAQESSFVPKMVLKTNPMAALGGPFWLVVVPITGEYRLLYEVKTVAKQSFTIGGSYLGPSLILNLDDITNDGSGVTGINTSGFRFQGMYKFYLTRTNESLEGFYVGPHVSYATAAITSIDDPADRIEAVKLNINGVIGYQLIADSGFALDIYTGLGFKNRTWNFDGDSGDLFSLDVQNVMTPSVAFGLNFGFAF